MSENTFCIKPVEKAEKITFYSKINEDKRMYENTFLTRYQKLEYIIDSVKNKKIVFKSPSTWTDPIEKKIMETSSVEAFLKENSLYCLCFTDNDVENEEAFWKTRKNGDSNLGCFRVKLDRFVECLKKSLETKFPGSFHIYVNQMNYDHSRDEIEKIVNNCDGTESGIVKALCVKRKAYKYENEVRIIIVINGKDYKTMADENNEPDKNTLTVNVDNITDCLSWIELEPVNSSLYKILKKKDINGLVKTFKEAVLKELGNKEIKISVSSLEEENIAKKKKNDTNKAEH